MCECLNCLCGLQGLGYVAVAVVAALITWMVCRWLGERDQSDDVDLYIIGEVLEIDDEDDYSSSDPCGDPGCTYCYPGDEDDAEGE